LHLAFEFFRRKQDIFWETWYCDIEVIIVLSFDMPDKIDAMDETTFNCFPYILSCRRVSTKSENIAATMFFRSLSKNVHSILAHIYVYTHF
jgi:hypothetical protein